MTIIVYRVVIPLAEFHVNGSIGQAISFKKDLSKPLSGQAFNSVTNINPP